MDYVHQGDKQAMSTKHRALWQWVTLNESGDLIGSWLKLKNGKHYGNNFEHIWSADDKLELSPRTNEHQKFMSFTSLWYKL